MLNEKNNKLEALESEQLDEDKIDLFKSDIYSLGIIMVEMMSLGKK